VRVSVRAKRRGAAVRFYDPGWRALVDGRAVATEMVAPALVGVRVGPGVHTVRFVYKGFPDYPQLLVLAA